MLYSIITFFKSLVSFKVQANEQKIFADWIYTVCMLLMLFFFVCYMAVDIIFLIVDTVSMTNLLIAFVFVFGAIFVYTMIAMLKRMSSTISQKTSEIIKTLVNAIEAKDQYTQGHSVHAEIVEVFCKIPKKEFEKCAFQFSI